jgi:hypothetical protein
MLFQSLVTSFHSSKMLYVWFSLLSLFIFYSHSTTAEEYYEDLIDTSLPQPLKDSDVKLSPQFLVGQKFADIISHHYL